MTRSELLDRAKDLLARYEQTVMVGAGSGVYRMALAFSIEKWIKDYEGLKSDPAKYLKITVTEE